MKTVAYSLNYLNEREYWWYRGRRDIIEYFIRRYSAVCGSRALKILDFGCGTGYMMERLGKFGAVRGADSSPEALEYCRMRALEDVTETDRVFWNDGAKYDLVTALDVLEHIDDEVLCLSRLGKKLCDGGVLIVTVPAYDILWSGEDVISLHRRRYTAAKLEKVLDASGYSVERLTYFNYFLLLPQLVFTLARKLLATEKYREDTNIIKLNPVLNSLLYSIFSSEKYFLKFTDFPAGASIIAAAVRRNS